MNQFRVIVAGSRHFTNYSMLTSHLDQILGQKVKTHKIVIISGCAKGADTMGERYAHDKGFAVEKFPAQWDKFGKSAGQKRNRQMADVADAVVAFWADGSRGTADMIRVAIERRIPLRTIKIN